MQVVILVQSAKEISRVLLVRLVVGVPAVTQNARLGAVPARITGRTVGCIVNAVFVNVLGMTTDGTRPQLTPYLVTIGINIGAVLNQTVVFFPVKT
jgi:hypothetical protein